MRKLRIRFSVEEQQDRLSFYDAFRKNTDARIGDFRETCLEIRE